MTVRHMAFCDCDCDGDGDGVVAVACERGSCSVIQQMIEDLQLTGES